MVNLCIEIRLSSGNPIPALGNKHKVHQKINSVLLNVLFFQPDPFESRGLFAEHTIYAKLRITQHQSSQIMSIKILSQFCTFVFCEVPCIYKTDRLWKPLRDEIDSLPAQNAIYNIPQDSTNVRIKESKPFSKMYAIRGVTESGFLEPMTSVAIPFKSITNKPDKDILLLAELKQNFIDLAEQFDVEIIVSKERIYSSPSSMEGGISFYVHLLGSESHVSTAYLHLWAVIEMYRNSKSNATPLFFECMDLEASSLLPTAIGVEMANIKNILASYKTHIHVPSLIHCFKLDAGRSENIRPQLFFTGQTHSLIIAAKDAISKAVEKYRASLYYRRFCNISPQKLLFIRKHYRPELNRLMVKFQSFIRVTDSYVEFQSPCLALLESVTKVFTINVLHQIVEIQITLNEKSTFPFELIRSVCLDDSNGPILAVILTESANQLLVVGNHSENTSWTKAGQPRLAKSGIIECLFLILSALPSNSLAQLKSVFEIHVDYEDFISGKKNGKVTRIMETIPCLIKLERLEEDNAMFLTLIADSLEDFNETFSLVINELPAEESFYIPEVYHRPVIGAGGSVIQATMKKYNVFVRFSNSFFLPQNELCHVRYDNVIIRCPYKNVSSISSAKNELNQLARDYGALQPRTLIRFSPGQYRYVLSSSSRGSQTIGNIEKKHNVYVMFPFVEPSEGYFLEIRGNDNAPANAALELISSSFGMETEIRLNKNIVLDDEFYSTLVIPFNYNMNVEVTATGSLLRITYDERNTALPKALNILNEWFKSKGLRILSKETIKDFIMSSKNGEIANDVYSNKSSDANKISKNTFQNQLSPTPLIGSADNQHFQAWASPQMYHTSHSDDRETMHPEYVKFSPRKHSNEWIQF